MVWSRIRLSPYQALPLTEGGDPLPIRSPARLLQHTPICAVPLCLGALLAVSPAHAQSAPSAEDMASARSLGTEGVRLAELGDCAGAVPKLEAAEKLFHAPTTLERLGECQIKIGRLISGTESLNRVVREPLPPNAPAAFVAARQRAQEALAPALPRIGKLRIHVDGAPVDKVTVTVDGVGVPSVLFDSDRPTDPGDHEVKAVATGYKTATATVSLKDGASAPVALKLDPDPNAVVVPLAGGTASVGSATPAGSTAPPPAAASSTGSSGLGKGLAIGSFAIGGVGVVLGATFGVLALSTKSKLDGECGASKTGCPASAQSDISSLSTRATVSTVGWGLGIAGVAAGIIFLVTSHGSEAATPPPPATARVSPWIGFGSAGLEGSF